jgi:hypothetical protein
MKNEKTKQVSVYVDADRYMQLRLMLVANGSTFSEWVRDHMKDDLAATRK